MRLVQPLFIMIAVFLAACGGGGGGGSDSPKPSVTLEGGDVPVAREAIQVLDVQHIPLEDDLYTGSVDGQSIALVPTPDGRLVTLLPATLPAGEHTLTLTVNGRVWDVPLEVGPVDVAPREESLAGLDATFVELRSVMDDAIAELTVAGAPQSEIDALVAQRDLLDTTQPNYDAFTDAQLDQFNKMLRMLIAEKPVPRGVFSERCHDRAGIYLLALGKMVVIVSAMGGYGALVGAEIASSAAVGGLLGSLAAPVAFVFAAGATAVVLSKAQSVANIWNSAWEECVFGSINELVTEVSDVSFSEGRAMPRVRSVQDSETELGFETKLPAQFRAETAFDMPDTFRDSFPSLRKIVTTLSFAIPDALEEKILERTAEDYTEVVPATMLSIEQISDPRITGQVEAVDEDSFRITFSVEPGVTEDELDFSFVLYDQEYQVKTRFQSSLAIPEHCPSAWHPDATLISLPDRCVSYYLAPPGERAYLNYHEYWKGVITRREHYQTGLSSLKALKGLEGKEDVPDYFVEAIPSTYTVLNIVVTDSGLASTEDYAINRWGENSHSRLDHTQPLQCADGSWTSVFSTWQFFTDSVLDDEYIYTPPLQTSDGCWTSVYDRHLYYSSGSLDRAFFYTAYQTDGSWDAWLSRNEDYGSGCWNNYNQDGEITDSYCPE